MRIGRGGGTFWTKVSENGLEGQLVSLRVPTVKTQQ